MPVTHSKKTSTDSGNSGKGTGGKTVVRHGGKSNVGSACALTFHMSGHDAAVCQSGHAAQVWAMECKVEGYVTVDVGNGGTTANTVPGASGNNTGNDGAADVILWTKDKVYIWEVKPGNAYGKTDGPKDLTRYVEGMQDYLEDEGDDRTVERGAGLLSGREASREGIVNVWSKSEPEYQGMRFYGRKNRDNPAPKPGPGPDPVQFPRPARAPRHRSGNPHRERSTPQPWNRRRARQGARRPVGRRVASTSLRMRRRPEWERPSSPACCSRSASSSTASRAARSPSGAPSSVGNDVRRRGL
ncbi:hypothetical protein AB0D38_11005 [Streptomyces sp. NPDC048279]|uniref:hypothetical protein n=1 Tax=Streptomyces sp. NPDC048279 TaxID=3154714 RepID=UPI00341E644A